VNTRKRKIRLVVTTTFFPNACNPQRAVFLKQLVKAMRGAQPIDIVAPLPFIPKFKTGGMWGCVARLGFVESFEQMRIFHPRVFIIPKLELFSALSYFVSVRMLLKRLARKNRLVVHAHCAYPDGVGAVMAAKSLGIPVVFTAHGSDINIAAKKLPLKWQIRWAVRSAAAVIGVSKPITEELIALAGRKKVSTFTIPCAGFDPSLFFPRERTRARHELGIETDGRFVLFIGNLLPIKGPEVLIDAWSWLQKTNRIRAGDRLFLVGSGPRGDALVERVEECCTRGSVVFAGARAHAEIPTWINSADLVCLPSYSEGTPNVVVESLACGVPVVASRVGGIPDIVEPGWSGQLVDPGNPRILAAAIVEVLAKKWDRLGLRKCVDGYQWENLARKNLEVIETVAANSV
jgi:glycosyltransferase involved in cell wall biosynthesis